MDVENSISLGILNYDVKVCDLVYACSKVQNIHCIHFNNLIEILHYESLSGSLPLEALILDVRSLALF